MFIGGGGSNPIRYRGGGGGGKGRFGYVWLILGKDFKISQKIVSQSQPKLAKYWTKFRLKGK